ncbi:unnamed protein product, partial [Sphacelaria rigidula]
MSASNSGNWNAATKTNDVQRRHDGRHDIVGVAGDAPSGPFIGELTPVSSRMPGAIRDTIGRLVSNSVLNHHYSNIMGGGGDGIFEVWRGNEAGMSGYGSALRDDRHIASGSAFGGNDTVWKAGQHALGWPLPAPQAPAAATAGLHGNSRGAALPAARNDIGSVAGVAAGSDSHSNKPPRSGTADVGGAIQVGPRPGQRRGTATSPQPSHPASNLAPGRPKVALPAPLPSAVASSCSGETVSAPSQPGDEARPTVRKVGESSAAERSGTKE